MLSIFVYLQKYANQSHGVCLRLIEQAIANVSKYMQIFVLPAVYNRRNTACIKTIYFPKRTFNSKTLSVNVIIFITRFEGKCKYFSFTKLESSWKLALSPNKLTNTVLDFVFVLYAGKTSGSPIFFLSVDFSKRQEMKVS